MTALVKGYGDVLVQRHTIDAIRTELIGLTNAIGEVRVDLDHIQGRIIHQSGKLADLAEKEKTSV